MTNPSPPPDPYSFRDGALFSFFIEVMVGDAVWPKFVEDCPYSFSMENIRLLNACSRNPLHLSAIQRNRDDTVLKDSQLGKHAVHL